MGDGCSMAWGWMLLDVNASKHACVPGTGACLNMFLKCIYQGTGPGPTWTSLVIRGSGRHASKVSGSADQVASTVFMAILTRPSCFAITQWRHSDSQERMQVLLYGRSFLLEIRNCGDFHGRLPDERHTICSRIIAGR